MLHIFFPFSPLDTEYITPFYEYHVPVFSCTSREVATDPQGYKVHVFRINTTSTDVLLQYNGIHIYLLIWGIVHVPFHVCFLKITEHNPSSAGLIFILDSRTPVGWRIAFLGDTSYNSEKRIILSEGSSIISNNQKSVSTVEFITQVGCPCSKLIYTYA